METYLTLLYVTLEQELALKDFFSEKGWTYCKPDLGVMTDKAGPFQNPQAIRTKSGGIITYSELSDNYEPAKTRSNKVVTKKRSTKVNISSSVPDIVKVEVSTEEDDFPSQSEDVENEVGEDTTENDDGDNDDDFADVMNSTDDREENDTGVAAVSNSPKKRGRPVRKTPKASLKKSNKDSGGSVTPGTSSGDQEEVSASGRKRRRVAAKADATIASIISEEKEEKEDASPFIDKQYLRSLLTEALRSSKSGKESSKTDFSVCPKCEKRVRNTNMRRHLFSHLDLPYRCTRCSGYFKSQDELERHREEKHVGEFICSYCGVKYRFKNSLTEHIQTRHEGTAKMYQCTVCGVKMCRKSHMDDHMNIHNNVNPYSCKSCSKSYKNKSAYKRHMKDCGSGIKYVCSECGQIYKSSTGLQDHLKRCHDDTNSHMFPCVCGGSFRTRSARCRHRIHCEKYQREKGSNPDLVQQNITILRVTSTPNEEAIKEDNDVVSQTEQDSHEHSANGQKVCYNLVEVDPDEANEINGLEEGEIIIDSETFNEFSEKRNSFDEMYEK
ncbi:zinc finger protein 37-like isoform X2 [Mercenaria mercenaria]|uniref:zinc finger protein 37-like isoform X2 n=1 Tax=Mercenaria mercenaria TaxID=6596 RepID=UPI00234EED9B|nr:zinc finger protein 37-like isoform X2 [Mercenaria mercenaria]